MRIIPIKTYATIALHYRTPQKSQDDFEVSYKGYCRQHISRDPEHWEINGNTAKNKTGICFPLLLEPNVPIRYVSVVSHGMMFVIRMYQNWNRCMLGRGEQPVFEPGDIKITMD